MPNIENWQYQSLNIIYFRVQNPFRNIALRSLRGFYTLNCILFLVSKYVYSLNFKFVHNKHSKYKHYFFNSQWSAKLHRTSQSGDFQRAGYSKNIKDQDAYHVACRLNRLCDQLDLFL